MEPSELIDKQISELNDWRGELITKLRKLIHEAEPNISEEWKWSTPVFTHNGMVCALGVFKEHIKINFFKGALLNDPEKLFNAGLEAKTSRGIDFRQNDKIDEVRLKNLICEAVGYNNLKNG